MSDIIETNGLAEFSAGLNGEDYQIEPEVPVVEDGQPEAAEPTEGASDSTEQESPDTQETHDDADAENKENPDASKGEAQEEKLYTVKHNKEEHQLTLEQLTAHAQKGMDYDRIRGQRDQLQSENESLKNQVGEYAKRSGLISQIDAIAQANNKTPEQLLMTLRRSVFKAQGMSDREIDLAIRAEDAERALEAGNEEEPESEGAARYRHDLQEFRELFPNVDPDSFTEEEQAALGPDIKAGMSMANAYQKMLNANNQKSYAEMQKKVEDLEKQLAAEKQNRKNYYQSPGSMNDSGGTIADKGLDAFKHGLWD